MARGPRRVLPFHIPFFHIFYSTSYTTLYIIEIGLLAITPATIIYTSIDGSSYQYVFMIGGVYVVTALLAIFIYSSRLYTRRSTMAGVGKAYLPIEEGEVGASVRRMIVKQLERSAIVAWESRPRDVEGEILTAEVDGVLPPETTSVGHNDYTVGGIIPVDPANPPWGRVEHAGWSSPAHRDDNKFPGVQFADAIAELPNLVEARAVSLAPPDPTATPTGEQPLADLAVVELLRRPETMGMRDYLTQLSYLGLVNPPSIGQSFMRHYEEARFGGRPTTEEEFARLMQTFSELLMGMTNLEPVVVEQIRTRVVERHGSVWSDTSSTVPSQTEYIMRDHTPSPPRSPDSDLLSPVTAREALSRTVTPYIQQQQTPSMDSFSSVIHRTPEMAMVASGPESDASSSLDSASTVSLPSDAGSVVRHRRSVADG